MRAMWNTVAALVGTVAAASSFSTAKAAAETSVDETICFELLTNQACCLWGPDPKLVACAVCLNPDGTCCYYTNFKGGSDLSIDVKIPGNGYYDGNIVITTFTSGCVYRMSTCPIPCSPSTVNITRSCDHGTIMFTPNPPCVPSP